MMGKGNEKGRVENAVGYVKKNFLAGLDIPDVKGAFDRLLRQWLDNIANVRIHGASCEKGRSIFYTSDEEKALLNPLPPHPFEREVGVTSARSGLPASCRITLEYQQIFGPSAEYAGMRLLLKAYPDRLCMSIFKTNSLPVMNVVTTGIRI